MAEITREQIEELRGLLTKATKGPWSTHLVDDTTIISPEREVATTCDSSQTEREDGYNIEYEQMEIDAALIVTMRNALPALLDIAETAIRNLEQSKGGEENVAGIPGNATSPGVTAGASEIEELCKRLGVLAADPQLLRRERNDLTEAAALIRRLVSERDNARAECAWLAKLLIRLREALNNIAEGAEDEGDRVYFGSTNDADWLKEIAREVESYAFDRIMRESKWPDYIESSAKANARATAAEAEVERLRAERDELRTFAQQATKAITGIAGGGSENFIRGPGEEIYLADVPYCEQKIRERISRAEGRRAHAALEGKSDG